MKKRSRSRAVVLEDDQGDNFEIDDTNSSDGSEDEDTEAGSGAEDTEQEDEVEDSGQYPARYEDDDEEDSCREAWDESVMEDVVAEVELEMTLNPNATRDGTLAIRKIITIAKKIHFSNPLRAAFLQTCEQKQCPRLIPPRHVATRWNSLTLTVQVALMVRPALVALTSSDKNGVQSLSLSTSEWKFIGQFVPVLEVCIFLSLCYVY